MIRVPYRTNLSSIFRVHQFLAYRINLNIGTYERLYFGSGITN